MILFLRKYQINHHQFLYDLCLLNLTLLCNLLKSFYDFIEIIDECRESNNELIQSLFYIINIEARYENNHEAIITLFNKYSELL